MSGAPRPWPSNPELQRRESCQGRGGASGPFGRADPPARDTGPTLLTLAPRPSLLRLDALFRNKLTLTLPLLRLDALFRNKMKSPTRGMRRPSLVDLRRAHEVSMPTGWSPASK